MQGRCFREIWTICRGHDDLQKGPGNCAPKHRYSAIIFLTMQGLETWNVTRKELWCFLAVNVNLALCLPWYQKPHGSPSKRFWKVSLWSYIVRSAPTFLLSLPVRHKQALGMCSECCQCRSSINGRSFRHAPVTWALTFSVERHITDLVRVSPSYPTSFEMKLTCDSQIFRRHPMYSCPQKKICFTLWFRWLKLGGLL